MKVQDKRGNWVRIDYGWWEEYVSRPISWPVATNEVDREILTNLIKVALEDKKEVAIRRYMFNEVVNQNFTAEYLWDPKRSCG